MGRPEDRWSDIDGDADDFRTPAEKDAAEAAEIQQLQLREVLVRLGRIETGIGIIVVVVVVAAWRAGYLPEWVYQAYDWLAGLFA